MQLTDKAIRSAKPRKTVYRLRDDNIVCRGFGLTVAPSGTKAFFLSFTSPVDGKRKQVSLGQYSEISLKKARVAAANTRALVDQGQDPAFDKKNTAALSLQSRSLGTLGDLMALYIEDLETDGKRTAKEVRRITAKDIPGNFLSRPAKVISKDDVLDILVPIVRRDAKVHADNVRAYLRAAFELGLHAEAGTRWRGRIKTFDLDHNPVAATKKASRGKPKGHRHLSAGEVNQLWHSTDLLPASKLALLLILTTGQRVEEVLGATWDEFDSEQMLWTIPGERRKNRNSTAEPHLVPLADLHLKLLADTKAQESRSTHLFPRRDGLGPRTYGVLTKATARFVERSGMQRFSPRDLRRTFKTLGGQFGLSLEIRNRLQGHAFTDVGSQHYDRYDYLTEKRQAMEQWIQRLQDIVRTER